MWRRALSGMGLRLNRVNFKLFQSGEIPQLDILKKIHQLSKNLDIFDSALENYKLIVEDDRTV